MKGRLATLAIVGLSSHVNAQDFHGAMQPVADYSYCVGERARAARPTTAEVEDTIASAMTKCKASRSRALSATRVRMKALGLPESTVKQSAEAMFASTEASMKESLRRELTSAPEAR